MIGGKPFDRELASDILARLEAEAAGADDYSVQGCVARLAGEQTEDFAPILQTILVRLVAITGLDPKDANAGRDEESLARIMYAYLEGLALGCRYMLAQQDRP